MYRMFLICLLSVSLTISGCWRKGVQSTNMKSTSSPGQLETKRTTTATGIAGRKSFATSFSAHRFEAPYDQIYYFNFDNSGLSEDDVRSVTIQAEYLRANPNSKVLVAGHTDIRGSREYNITLGEKRGISVVDILRLQGVKESQIKLVSYGKEKLAVKSNSEQAHGKNRRVEFTYRELG